MGQTTCILLHILPHSPFSHFIVLILFSEYNITVDHRPFSNQVMLLTDNVAVGRLIMLIKIFTTDSLLLFTTGIIIVIIIAISLPFLTKAI